MPPPIPVHPFILEVLRGMGQVVFCNSTLTGAALIGGLCLEDPHLAATAIIGCAAATATAQQAGLDAALRSAGLFGHNGALMGCAFSVFLGAPFPVTAAAAAAGGAATALLAGKIGPAVAPMPSWTLAFNACALLVLALMRPLAPSGTPSGGPAAPGQAGEQWRLSDADYLDWFEAAFMGISQICVTNNSTTGILITFGIFTYSPCLAGAALIGAAVGALTAAILGADAEEVLAGLWSYNSALAAMAVAVFFVPLGAPFAALLLGAAAAAALCTGVCKMVITYGLKAPPLTVPFCMVASGMFLLSRRGLVPGIVPARTPHSPEANILAYRLGR